MEVCGMSTYYHTLYNQKYYEEKGIVCLILPHHFLTSTYHAYQGINLLLTVFIVISSDKNYKCCFWWRCFAYFRIIFVVCACVSLVCVRLVQGKTPDPLIWSTASCCAVVSVMIVWWWHLKPIFAPIITNTMLSDMIKGRQFYMQMEWWKKYWKGDVSYSKYVNNQMMTFLFHLYFRLESRPSVYGTDPTNHATNRCPRPRFTVWLAVVRSRQGNNGMGREWPRRVIYIWSRSRCKILAQTWLGPYMQGSSSMFKPHIKMLHNLLTCLYEVWGWLLSRILWCWAYVASL